MLRRTVIDSIGPRQCGELSRHSSRVMGFPFVEGRVISRMPSSTLIPFLGGLGSLINPFKQKRAPFLSLGYWAAKILASVMRSLLFGTQCREVTARTVRRWQCWINTVAREATHTQVSTMHDNQQTQRDLNKSLLGWWPAKVMIGQVQVMHLGHVARLPLHRPERAALFGWLELENP